MKSKNTIPVVEEKKEIEKKTIPPITSNFRELLKRTRTIKIRKRVFTALGSKRKKVNRSRHAN